MAKRKQEECSPRVNTPAALFTWQLQHPEVPWNSAQGTPPKPPNHTSAKANMTPSQQVEKQFFFSLVIFQAYSGIPPTNS